MKERIFVNYTTLRFTDAFWQAPAGTRAAQVEGLCAAIAGSADAAAFYQVYPARAEYDLFAWTTVKAEALEAPDRFFEAFATAVSPYRRYVATPEVLCGITKPSMYTGNRPSPQEIDPLEGERKPYFVVYPFSKTVDWYLKDREERQRMMSAHIKVGRGYPEIMQLLLYSFGIQDQEFVVAYEMEDLAQFSDLVQTLRSTEARAYTLCDTPIITGCLRSPDALARIFGGEANPHE